MAQETTLQKLHEITSQIIANGNKSSTLGSLSGIIGLGTAAALLGPVGLISGGAGAAIAGYFLKHKLEKENALKQIESAVHGMDDEQLQKFVNQLKEIPIARISSDFVGSVLSNIINNT